MTTVSQQPQMSISGQVKLSQLELPKFDVAYEDWAGFSDAFHSAIHNSTQIDYAEKLIDLKTF